MTSLPKKLADARDAFLGRRRLAYEVAGFKIEKAGQAARFFITQAGGRIDKLKLVKLLYLVERENMARYDAPMTYDELYSLPHGPVGSASLNGLDGALAGSETWDRITTYGKQDVHSARASREELDELSNADLGVLEHVWASFGHMSASQIRNWTHNPANCPEYTEVVGARLPIQYEDVLKALGKDDAEGIAAEINEFRRLDVALNKPTA